MTLLRYFPKIFIKSYELVLTFSTVTQHSVVGNYLHLFAERASFVRLAYIALKADGHRFHLRSSNIFSFRLDHEIICTAIFSLMLIQVWLLSVTDIMMCTK